MKAIICTKSGPPEVLQLREVERPVPRDNEVLIRVHASTVTQGDVMLRKLHPLLFLPMRLFGVKQKRTPGHEFAGVVDGVGKAVKRFRKGEAVFGTTTGLSVGANAEYVCLPEEWSDGVLALKPSNATFEEAAALPVGGMTALYILRQANIRRGQKVLVYGASGSVGTYAVQIARQYFGAKVTGVCSTRNIDLVRALGAEMVIDYTREDITSSGETYDVIFDAVGKLSSSKTRNMLKENVTFLTVQSSTTEELENLIVLRNLMEEEKLKPVIDKCYSLEQAAEAHRYVEAGHKKGNVVISVGYSVN
ncbi:MAG TPA: NAD(P)-dependent alcohol dehydrogenase [Anaerolineales bacterium]|nr:NAD(P)-dependent alcohol dehydrogenase [Anaerolineales bacterium]